MEIIVNSWYSKFILMKRVLLLLVMVLAISPTIFAGDNKKKKTTAQNEIEWLTWDEAQTRMKKNPKKVWVDVYTDWCGWCKVMDKKTYSDPQVVKYMNDNFYAVKFNSERDDSIKLLGKLYIIKPENKVNDLALELLRGQLSYPTNVILEEHFQNPIPVPGYLAVPQIDMVMHYTAENHYKSTPWEDYKKTFVGTWKEQPVAPAN